MSIVTRRIENLRPCPCGETPEELILVEGSSAGSAFVSGSCCDEWLVEFRTRYYDLTADNPEMEKRMVAAWNAAPRKEETEGRVDNESTN